MTRTPFDVRWESRYIRVGVSAGSGLDHPCRRGRVAPLLDGQIVVAVGDGGHVRAYFCGRMSEFVAVSRFGYAERVRCDRHQLQNTSGLSESGLLGICAVALIEQCINSTETPKWIWYRRSAARHLAVFPHSKRGYCREFDHAEFGWYRRGLRRFQYVHHVDDEVRSLRQIVDEFDGRTEVYHVGSSDNSVSFVRYPRRG